MSYNYAPFKTFNGVSDFLWVPDSPELRLIRFSCSAWFLTSKANYTTDGFIVNKGGTGSEVVGENLNYGLWIRDTEQIRGGFEESDGIDHIVSSPLTYNDGLWHFALVTYDGVTVRLYIDGTEVATHATTATPTTSVKDLVVGRNSREQNDFFEGNIDEVRVWNRALTPTEASDLFTDNIVSDDGLVYQNVFGLVSEINPSSLLVFYSGGTSNADPFLSKGGNKSTVEINYSAIDKTFKSSTKAEDDAGLTDFRGFYVTNGHATKTIRGIKMYVHKETTALGDQILVAKCVEGKNAVMEALGSVTTPPAGSPFFTQANNPNQGILIGDLLPGEFIGVWFKRIINPNTPSFPDNLGQVGLFFSSEEASSPNTPPPEDDSTVNNKIALAGTMSCNSNFKASLERIKARAADLFVSVGDNAFSSGSGCWIKLIKDAGYGGAKSVITFGNNDSNEDYRQPQTRQNLINAFSLPAMFYERVFNNIYFLVLDSENTPETGSDFTIQKARLAAASANPNIEWLFVLHHRPIYGPASNHDNEDDVRDVWDPLFDQYGVDCVFTGHNRLCWQSDLIRYDTVSPSSPIVVSTGTGDPVTYKYNRGTVNHGKLYFGTGNGGRGHHDADDNPSYLNFLNDTTFGYMYIEQFDDGKKLDIRHYSNNDIQLNRVILEHLI